MSKIIKFNKTKEWLYNEYVINNKSREQIAEEANVSLATVKEYIRKWQIYKPKLTIKKDDLISLIEQGYTTSQIAEKYNCHPGSIFRYYRRYNIEQRNPDIYVQYDDTNDAEYIRLYNEGKSTLDIAKMYNTTATAIRSHLLHNGIARRNPIERMWTYHKKEIPQDFNDYQKLYNLYIIQNLSKAELMKRYNCTYEIINRVLKSHGLIETNDNTRTITSLSKRVRTYFNKLTPIVLNRDNNTCQLCGCHDNLQVHHVVSFKHIFHSILADNPDKNVIDDFDELYDICINDKDLNNTDNLITYCKECHMNKIHNFGN